VSVSATRNEGATFGAAKDVNTIRATLSEQTSLAVCFERTAPFMAQTLENRGVDVDSITVKELGLKFRP
jgi:hypothetical protein